MGNKYAVLIEGGTAAEKDAITLALQQSATKVWHWMTDVWLLDGVADNRTPKSIHDELAKVLEDPKRTMLVMNLGSGKIPYWGMGNPHGWNWMTEVFGPPM